MSEVPPLKKIQTIIENFRDIADYNNGYIKKGIIFRSSSPIAFQSPTLKRLFKEIGICSIIDLRSVVEIKTESYKDDFIKDFNYYWVHVDISMPEDVFIKEGISHLSLYHQFCWYILNYNKYQIEKIFDILSKKENYAIVIHCFAGRDRTGVIIALILLLMNAPEKGIIEDYLASDGFTDAEDIKYIIDFIKSKGGINSYLQSCGVSLKTQEQVKSILKA